MRSTGRRNPALIELVLVILFLALTAAVLAQAFAKARTMSADSRAQTAGMITAQDVIERWKADPADTAALFPADDGWRSEDGQVFTLLRDENMQPPDENKPDYLLRAELSAETSPAGALCSIRVTVSGVQDEDGQPLVDCATSLYLPDGSDKDSQPSA